MKNLILKLIINYLKILTCSYIKREKVEVIGLTGSVGETTLTLAIHKILSLKYRVGMTFKQGHGLNSETGIPLAILGVHVDGFTIVEWLNYLIKATFNFFFKRCEYEKIVVEMGVDKPNDMEFLLSMIKPKVGVFLSISKVHTEKFQSLYEKTYKKKSLLDLVFEEKAKLIRSLPENGYAVLNNDNRSIINFKKEIKCKTISFGLESGSNILGKIISVSSERFVGTITYESQEDRIIISDYLINKGIFTTFLASTAVGAVYGIDIKSSVKSLEDLKLPPGRMSKLTGVRDIVIIDSSYNASKLAVIEALDNLALYKNRKKIAVLGDMRELGSEEKGEHEKIARKAVKIAHEIITVGPAMKCYFVPEALKHGFNKGKIHTFDNTWNAMIFLRDKLIKGGEAILVKGSQNTLYMEIIVEGILKDKSKKEEVLCRRGDFWNKKREALKPR